MHQFIERINTIPVTSCYRLPHPFSDIYQRFPKWLALADNEELKEMDPLRVYVAKRVCERHFAGECFVVGTNKLKKNALPCRELPVKDLMGTGCTYPGTSELTARAPFPTMTTEAEPPHNINSRQKESFCKRPGNERCLTSCWCQESSGVDS
ncbi:uncharacterized protein LOC124154462 [Ischnura elegans]|uniref:uncharacterized protein LOC124154462 n=1 Tax=Ischnura elegans TaxID=197161 RepID=UPI001ED8B0D9|nr:uncharacterized protein LOC124154462 [Ischnura elegans]